MAPGNGSDVDPEGLLSSKHQALAFGFRHGIAKLSGGIDPKLHRFVDVLQC